MYNNRILATIGRPINIFCNCHAGKVCAATRRTSSTKLNLVSTSKRQVPFSTNSIHFISIAKSGIVGRGSHIIVNGPGPSLCNGFGLSFGCGHLTLSTLFACSLKGSTCGTLHRSLRSKGSLCGRSTTVSGH